MYSRNGLWFLLRAKRHDEPSQHTTDSIIPSISKQTTYQLRRERQMSLGPMLFQLIENVAKANRTVPLNKLPGRFGILLKAQDRRPSSGQVLYSKMWILQSEARLGSFPRI